MGSKPGPKQSVSWADEVESTLVSPNVKSEEWLRAPLGKFEVDSNGLPFPLDNSGRRIVGVSIVTPSLQAQASQPRKKTKVKAKPAVVPSEAMKVVSSATLPTPEATPAPEPKPRAVKVPTVLSRCPEDSDSFGAQEIAEFINNFANTVSQWEGMPWDDPKDKALIARAGILLIQSISTLGVTVGMIPHYPHIPAGFQQRVAAFLPLPTKTPIPLPLPRSGGSATRGTAYKADPQPKKLETSSIPRGPPATPSLTLPEAIGLPGSSLHKFTKSFADSVKETLTPSAPKRKLKSTVAGPSRRQILIKSGHTIDPASYAVLIRYFNEDFAKSHEDLPKSSLHFESAHAG